MQIPEFIEIRNAIGQRQAFLSPQADGLKDCWIDQRLNAECVLSFSLPLISDKWAELAADTTGELWFLAGIEKAKLRGGGKDEKVVQVEDALD